jgi:AsmA protein
MGRRLRWIGIGLAALVLVLASLPFLVDANQFRPLLESNLGAALGREVKLGKLSLALLSGGVTADDLSVADDPAFSPAPFVRAKSLKVSVELWPLITTRKLNVTGLTINQPEISLLQSPSGEWNYSSLGSKAHNAKDPAPPSHGALDLSVKQVKITGGRLSLGKTKSSAKPLVLEKVALDLSDFSSGAVFPFSLSADVAGGGSLKLKGKAGPIDPADAAMTPVDAEIGVSDLDIVSSGVVDPSTGLAGLVSLEGKAASNGKSLQAQGRLKGSKLKLAKNGTPAQRALEYNFALNHDLKKHSGQISRGDVHIGAAAATLTGSYSQHGESTVVRLDFSGPNMPVPELVGLLPALGIVLPSGSSLEGGAARARLNVQGPTNRLVSTGSLAVSDTKLTGFNLGAKLTVLSSLAGLKTGPTTEIQAMSADVEVTPAGTTIQDLRLVVPTIGDLSGSGTVSPSHALDFKMRAVIHTTGQVMSELGQRGDTAVPFFVGGTSSNPVIRPDVQGLAKEKIKGTLEKTPAGKAAGEILDQFGIFGGKKK